MISPRSKEDEYGSESATPSRSQRASLYNAQVGTEGPLSGTTAHQLYVHVQHPASANSSVSSTLSHVPVQQQQVHQGNHYSLSTSSSSLPSQDITGPYYTPQMGGNSHTQPQSIIHGLAPFLYDQNPLNAFQFPPPGVPHSPGQGHQGPFLTTEHSSFVYPNPAFHPYSLEQGLNDHFFSIPSHDEDNGGAGVTSSTHGGSGNLNGNGNDHGNGNLNVSVSASVSVSVSGNGNGSGKTTHSEDGNGNGKGNGNGNGKAYISPPGQPNPSDKDAAFPGVLRHTQFHNTTGSMVHQRSATYPTDTKPEKPPSSKPKRSSSTPSTRGTLGMTEETARRNRCARCEKQFKRPSSLQTHLFSHTGEKPFQCSWIGCGRHFSVRSNMIRHQKLHERDSAAAAAAAAVKQEEEVKQQMLPSIPLIDQAVHHEHQFLPQSYMLASSSTDGHNGILTPK